MGAAARMGNTSESRTIDFAQTPVQKILYLAIPIILAILITINSTRIAETIGTFGFLLLGLLLGLLTFVITLAWGYRVVIDGSALRITNRTKTTTIPLDRIGIVARNGGVLFPTIWVVLRNADAGEEIPSKGVNPQTRELIDAYMKRNPGKKLSYVLIRGGYLRSAKLFAREIKRRIPPVVVDERLLK